MDEQRFDAMTRLLGASQTRRGTLRQSLAGLGALAVTAAPDLAEVGNARKRRKNGQRRRRRKRCRGGLTRCFGRCTNTRTDPKHCGFCGKDCDEDEICRNGECEPDCGGLTLCGNDCVDTDVDLDHCGGCDNECDGGEDCRDGACGAPCDVCASGCAFTSLQAAVSAADAGDTIRLCPGSYDTQDVVIGQNLTIIGAGAGPGGTVLDAGGDPSHRVLVIAAGNVVIRTLTVTGGNMGTLAVGGGAGIFIEDAATLDLVGVSVTGNTNSGNGGGIANFGTLTLDVGTSVTANTAASGGGVFNEGVVTGNPGISVTGNTPDDCVDFGIGTGC